MPLLVTSAAGVSGDGYGVLLAFGRTGRSLGAFSSEARIADPPGLAVDEQKKLLFLNSGSEDPAVGEALTAVPQRPAPGVPQSVRLHEACARVECRNGKYDWRIDLREKIPELGEDMGEVSERVDMGTADLSYNRNVETLVKNGQITPAVCNIDHGYIASRREELKMPGSAYIEGTSVGTGQVLTAREYRAACQAAALSAFRDAAHLMSNDLLWRAASLVIRPIFRVGARLS